jgi:hypothetical protein
LEIQKNTLNKLALMGLTRALGLFRLASAMTVTFWELSSSRLLARGS